jgi:hypothetical protein
MYTDINFKSKKDLKAAVAAGKQVTCYSPGPFPCATEGRITLEGPHYPEPHRWYATAILKDGVIIKVS